MTAEERGCREMSQFSVFLFFHLSDFCFINQLSLKLFVPASKEVSCVQLGCFLFPVSVA